MCLFWRDTHTDRTHNPLTVIVNSEHTWLNFLHTWLTCYCCSCVIQRERERIRNRRTDWYTEHYLWFDIYRIDTFNHSFFFFFSPWQHQSWTDDLPLCQMCGVGTAPNCVYSSDGKGTQSHTNEDGHLRFRWGALETRTLFNKNSMKNKRRKGITSCLEWWPLPASQLNLPLTPFDHHVIYCCCFFLHQSEARMAVSCMGFLTVMMAAEWPVLPPSVWQLNCC